MHDSLLTSELIKKLNALKLETGKPVRGFFKGERRSREKGHSMEFADFRSYVQGDDLRLIDWNIYGRHNQLFLKLHEDEQDLEVHILIDCSLSMGLAGSEKLNYAKKIAGALGYLTLKNNEKLNSAFFSDKIHNHFRSAGGMSGAINFFDFVVNQQASGSSKIIKSVKEYILKKKSLNGMVIILTDGFTQDDMTTALNLLGSKKCQVIFVHILSGEDTSPSVDGSIRLVDVETGEDKEVTINQSALKQYKSSFNLWQKDLLKSVEGRNMKYVMASTEIPLDEFILSNLRVAGILS